MIFSTSKGVGKREWHQYVYLGLRAKQSLTAIFAISAIFRLKDYRWFQYIDRMPDTRRNNTAEVSQGWVKMKPFRFILCIIILGFQ